jgi:hypothetical protein
MDGLREREREIEDKAQKLAALSEDWQVISPITVLFSY